MFKFPAALVLLAVLLSPLVPGAPVDARSRELNLFEIGGSGVNARVEIFGIAKGLTRIQMTAAGLTPGEDYAVVYYDTYVCGMHPRETAGTDLGRRWDPGHEVGIFRANSSGVAVLNRNVEESFVDIRSVSVRRAHNRTPLACIDVP
jgi:hypothetical protein